MLELTASPELCDRTFLAAGQLKQILALPAAAWPLLVLGAWQHPNPGLRELASDAPDLLLAIETLRQRRAISASLTATPRETYLRDHISLFGRWGESW